MFYLSEGDGPIKGAVIMVSGRSAGVDSGTISDHDDPTPQSRNQT